MTHRLTIAHSSRVRQFTCLALFAIMLTSSWARNACAQDAIAQDANPQDSGEIVKLRNEVGTLNDQVTLLNARVATLERLLLTQIIEATPENSGHLQAELELADERLAHTERLFEKGYASELQVQAERYAVERVELRLDLAAMAADPAEFSASLQLFEAQAKLNLALQRLEHSEKLAARGYITPAQLRADELDVQRTRQQVEQIKAELQQVKDKAATDNRSDEGGQEEADD